MANEQRVRGNLTSGTLNGALTNVATSMTAANLSNLPAVGSTQHAVIVIENEIVYVTAHTGGTTTATILRGQEGTTAAAHNNGVAWVHGPVASDFDSVLGYAQVTANQTGIGTAATDLTGLAVTVTVPYAQHRVKITGFCGWSSASSAVLAILNIQEGATVFQQVASQNAAASTNMGVTAQAVIIPTAASHTYKLALSISAGTSPQMLAGATFPAFILVEDLGPAL